jgi:hypothetical protein
LSLLRVLPRQNHGDNFQLFQISGIVQNFSGIFFQKVTSLCPLAGLPPSFVRLACRTINRGEFPHPTAFGPHIKQPTIEDTTMSEQQEDGCDRLVHSLQYGDPSEAAEMLRQRDREAASNAKYQQELERSQGVLDAFTRA